jgi:hypothetical protein
MVRSSFDSPADATQLAVKEALSLALELHFRKTPMALQRDACASATFRFQGRISVRG